ncbi:unnamed protein product [Prorocentrum cordatum]|uniref:Uncharacterized protein n=1 Tax=Prorocentrum cordatum TaxID=2364126 RepID=A0ABN9S887_9DINO|nr:unnamed protein product [Polarella glacialis]
MADLSAVFSEADTVILSCRLWPASRQFDSHRFGSGSTTASCNDKSMPLSDLSEVAGGVLAEQCGEPLAGFSSAQGTAAHEAGVDVVQSRRRRIAQRRALGRERLMRAQPGGEGEWSEHLCGFCSSDCRQCAASRAVDRPPAVEERSG